MPHQEYPKALYRGSGAILKCKIAQNEQEHEAAKLEGWGPHPSTIKPAELLRKPEPASTEELDKPAGKVYRTPWKK